MDSAEGRGCAMRECNDEVLLGIMRPSSLRVGGRSGDFGCVPLREGIVRLDVSTREVNELDVDEVERDRVYSCG